MIVFSADWQLQARNLDKAKRVEEAIWALHQKHTLAAFVHAGDVKHVLNPMDGRVVNYTVDMIQRMTRSFPVCVLLGNHDKFSNQAVADDWLTVLGMAGASTFSQPGRVSHGGWNLNFLPYNTDLDTARKWAAKLAENVSDKTVLVMHETVIGCSLPGKIADDGLTLEELNADKYFAVLGGHIHKPQQLGANFHYIGSPWCHDWGEVNQRKSLITLRKKLDRVPLDLPGLFDPSRKDFYVPKTWAGSTVRVTVTGPDTMLGTLREKAAEQAVKDYPGATVAVTALREDSLNTGTVKVSSDDSKTITRYVSKTVPTYLADRAGELSSYLLYKLKEAGAVVRTGEGVQFIEAEGRNFLSFEHVKHTFGTGITVVRGVSQDWKDRSNGSGKTNFVQMVAVALSGFSMKGQTNDGWVRRDSRGEAFVSLTMKLADGRTLKVERRRRPKAMLRLWLDGNPHHTGAGPRETQKELEDLTGFTYETLENSVYLDQGKVNQMLSGTDAERKGLLTKFLNLERFEKARKLVTGEQEKVHRKQASEAMRLDSVSASGERIRATLDGWKNPDVAGLERALAKALKAASSYVVEKRTRQSDEAHTEQLAKLNRLMGRVEADASNAQATRDRADKLGVECNRCGQKVPAKYRAGIIAEQDKELKVLEAKLAEIIEQRRVVREQIDAIAKENARREQLYLRQVNEQLRLQSDAERLEKELKSAKAEAERRDKLVQERNQLRAEYKALKKQVADLENESVFLDYAAASFGRLGIPALLMGEACPALNAAAEYYAGLISNHEIQVRFHHDGDSISVSVHNKYGGETLKDQSCGETRTASLIVSLATLEVTTQCNLLIADEPGGGLDEVGAAGFAEVLRTVSGKFGCVLIISHNPYILAELEDYPQIVVEKGSGVSRVC